VLGCSAVEANRSSLEAWMMEENASVIEHMRDLYHEIKGRGLKIFIISSRKEYLRDATVNNLVKVGYRGWTELILRYSRLQVPTTALKLWSCDIQFDKDCCLF